MKKQYACCAHEIDGAHKFTHAGYRDIFGDHAAEYITCTQCACRGYVIRCSGCDRIMRADAEPGFLIKRVCTQCGPIKRPQMYVPPAWPWTYTDDEPNNIYGADGSVVATLTSAASARSLVLSMQHYLKMLNLE